MSCGGHWCLVVQSPQRDRLLLHQLASYKAHDFGGMGLVFGTSGKAESSMFEFFSEQRLIRNLEPSRAVQEFTSASH